MKLTNILSSLLVGGLVLGSADAQPKPPKPPPKPPKVHVQVDGLEEMIEEHIQHALDSVGAQGNIPPAVRNKVMKRIEKVREKVKAKVRSGKLDPESLGELGEELGEEMEQFGEEMEEWGEKFAKDMEKQMGKLHSGSAGGVRIDIDLGDDDDNHLPDIDIDDEEDLDDAVRDLGTLKLGKPQREEIRKLRAESDAKVAAAKRELDRASDQLRKQLDNPATSDADIARSIDAVTQQEAAIRKARILAWVNARRVLDDAQRKQVEGAVKRKSK